MGRSAVGPPGRWFLGPNAVAGPRGGEAVPYPGALLCEPTLALVVMDRGALLGRSGAWELRRYNGSIFPVRLPGQVWRPLTCALPFLRLWADQTLNTASGRIYQWADLCSSERPCGETSPLYPSFDDWIWQEATRVGTGDMGAVGGRATRYHLHSWSGSFFVSVDPQPAPFCSFDTQQGALRHALYLAR